MKLGTLTRKIAKLETQVRERGNATERHLLYQFAMLGVPVRAGAPFTRGQRTVLIWPRRLSVKDWDAAASMSQMKLMADTREEFAPVAAPLLGPEHDDVTHKYKPSSPSPVDTTPLEQRVRTAQENYVLALKSQCSATSCR